MKKFTFRLESALSLRRFRKQGAALAFADATARRTEVALRLDDTRNLFLKARAASIPEEGARVTADEMVRRQASIAFLENELIKLREIYRDLLGKEDDCYRELMESKQEEEALLRIKAKAREIHRLEIERSDERAVEEFVNAKHGKAFA